MVGERTVPFYRAASPSRGTLIGKVGKIVGELSHARFDGIMHTVSALSLDGNNEDLEFLAGIVSPFIRIIPWKILLNIKKERNRTRESVSSSSRSCQIFIFNNLTSF